MSATSDRRPLRLEPDDLLFFRDGKPSTRGSDHYLHSLFPPHPSTLYGAIRTRRLLDGGVSLSGLREKSWAERLGDLADELGPWGGFGSLELRGPWLVRGDEVLLPAPADLGLILAPRSREEKRLGVAETCREVVEVIRYRLEPAAETRWSHPLGTWQPYRQTETGWEALPIDEARLPKPSAGWYLRPAGLETWARGEVPKPEDLVGSSALWVDEVRTGVGLRRDQDIRQAETGLLYTFGFIRLHRGISLGFEIQGSGLEAEGRVRLGGEARTAEIFPGPPLPARPEPSPELSGVGEPFLLTFATPALAAGGAWPPGFSPGRAEGELGGGRCRLLGAIVPGATLVGGWDVARGQPKPLRRALPAGAVFAFEWLDEPPAAGAGAPWGRNLSDFEDEHLARQGFGLTFSGQCP